eukprot:TRINITY_DN28481_c0_g1_i1.p1 TRINITY_DN28481_c0_g1~~TRINITY_DN28481_c0_g1_i1.p1  ORF type:complete len:449 (-),score=106.06 TRINITY_DN28481_c0_g1_i1:248-1594(-)
MKSSTPTPVSTGGAFTSLPDLTSEAGFPTKISGDLLDQDSPGSETQLKRQHSADAEALSRAVEELSERLPELLWAELKTRSERLGKDAGAVQKAFRTVVKKTRRDSRAAASTLGTASSPRSEPRKARIKKSNSAETADDLCGFGSSSPTDISKDSSSTAELSLAELEAQIQEVEAQKASLSRTVSELEQQNQERESQRLAAKDDASSGSSSLSLGNLWSKVGSSLVFCPRRERLDTTKFQSAPAKIGGRTGRTSGPLSSMLGCGSACSAADLPIVARKVAWATSDVANGLAFLCDLATMEILQVSSSAAGALRMLPTELIGKTFLSLLAQQQQSAWVHKAILTAHTLAHTGSAASEGDASSTLGSFALRSGASIPVTCLITVVHLAAAKEQDLAASVIVFLSPERSDGSRPHGGSDVGSERDSVASHGTGTSVDPADSASNIGYHQRW